MFYTGKIFSISVHSCATEKADIPREVLLHNKHRPRPRGWKRRSQSEIIQTQMQEGSARQENAYANWQISASVETQSFEFPCGGVSNVCNPTVWYSVQWILFVPGTIGVLSISSFQLLSGCYTTWKCQKIWKGWSHYYYNINNGPKTLPPVDLGSQEVLSS